jgi:hypothetical protein
MKRILSEPWNIRLFVIILAATCWLSKNIAKADQIVVPNSSANSQTPNAGEGIFNETIRYQAVYGSSQFPPYPIVISAIQWRPDSYQGGPVTNVTITNIQINLSTTTNSADHLSLVFAQNSGLDNTLVFNGTLVLSTASTTQVNGTKVFDINLPLQTPFVYDPSKGNLLLDVRNFTGGAPFIYDNDVAESSDSVSRIFTTDGNVNSLTAGAGDSGAGVIQVTYEPPASPPIITLQPTNQTVVVGSNTILSVSAASGTLLKYQWFFKDASHPIIGATNSILSLSNLQTNQAGIYFVQVSNSYAPVISSNATLSVIPLRINIEPADQVTEEGGSTSFQVGVESGAPLSYQWYFNSTNLVAGATNSTLILTNAQLDKAGFYFAQVSNVYGSTNSSSASLNFGLVIPNYAASNQTPDADGSFSTPFREDDVYASSEFPQYPILIKEIRFRPAGAVGGPISTVLSNVQFNLSTTKALPDQLNANFDQNIGPDNTTVFAGTLSLSTAFADLPNGTKAFDLRVQLQTGFVFNPSQGNLYLDFRNFSGSTPSEPNFINNIGGLDGASRMFTSDPNGTSGLRDSGGYVLQIIYGLPTVPPIISSQPTNRSATLGGSSIFTVVAGSAYPVSYQWFFTDTNNAISGATNASLTLTNLQQSQAGIYLVIATNAYGTALSSNALLTVTTDPPSITGQPLNRSGIVGTNFTFSVAAFGSLPLSYQWFYNTNTPIDGATNATLVLTNIQFNQSGKYSVLVSNAYGATNSIYAVLSISYPPVKLFMGTTNIPGGSSFAVPIYMIANGNESALGFSIGFNTQRLAYATADLGKGGGDAGLFVNTSQSSNGKVGITMTLPYGETFAPGTQEVVRITFASGFVTNSPVTTPVNFTNVPIARSVSDFNQVKLATNFINTTVTLGVTDFEGDVNPRVNGDHSLDIFDWSQVGRFVAGLDTISNAAEFQRADCAPTNTSGDGMLKVTDWVQAGRYGALIDPARFVSGPSAPVTPIILTGGPRIVNIAGGIAVKGLNFTVPVILQSQGNENAIGFSAKFDPTLLKFVSVAKGGSAGSATLLVNSNQALQGNIGVLLALQNGNHFTNGTQPEIAKLTFTALDTTTNSAIIFTNSPVLLAISDPGAIELAAVYTNSSLIINQPPALTSSLSDTNVNFTWPTWGTGFILQATGDLTQPWTNVVYTAQTNGSNISITLPLAGQGGYFRLQHP